jgi:hypothetical protein
MTIEHLVEIAGDPGCPELSRPQTAFAIGEHAHHMDAPLEFLIEALKHVGRLHLCLWCASGSR